MVKRNFRKVYLLLAVILFGLIFTGCGSRIEACREENIAIIDNRLKEIQDMELEYDLSVIAYEAEKAKEAIASQKDRKEIQKIAEKALITLDQLILPEEEMLQIKKAFYVHFNGDFGKFEETLPKMRIKHYLGKVGDLYVAVVKDDVPMLLLPSAKSYFAGLYTFRYLPEVVSVYKDNIYYSLSEMSLRGEMSEEDLALIYERFTALNR